MQQSQQPQRVIVYRSRAEQMQEDYLLGDGLFSPMGATDILIIISVVAGLIIGFARIKNSRRH